MESFRIFQKKPAGCWIISGNLHFYVDEKPSLLVMFFSKLLLQWKWQSNFPTAEIDSYSWSYTAIKEIIKRVKSGKAGPTITYTKNDLRLARELLNRKRDRRACFYYGNISAVKSGAYTRFISKLELIRY